MVTVGISSSKPKRRRIAMNPPIHFTHLSYGIFATPRTPINTPEVGVIILVKPSPNWKALTVV